jgi:hypothetical protein
MEVSTREHDPLNVFKMLKATGTITHLDEHSSRARSRVGDQSLWRMNTLLTL